MGGQTSDLGGGNMTPCLPLEPPRTDCCLYKNIDGNLNEHASSYCTLVRLSLLYCCTQQLCGALRQYHNGLDAAKRLLAELQAHHRFATFIQVVSPCQPPHSLSLAELHR